MPQQTFCSHLCRVKADDGNDFVDTDSDDDSNDTGAVVQEVDAEELEAILATREVPIVVDCFANWCGPCKLVADELEHVQVALGESVKVVKLDTEKHPSFVSELGIQGLPTLLFVSARSNVPAYRHEGLIQRQSIIDVCKQLM